MLLSLSAEDKTLLESLPEGILNEFCIVADVELRELPVNANVVEPIAKITRATGEKCPRCWNVRTLGEDAAHPDVCSRCSAVLTELGL